MLLASSSDFNTIKQKLSSWTGPGYDSMTFEFEGKQITDQ
jgi:Ubiquitin family